MTKQKHIKNRKYNSVFSRRLE